MRQFLVVSILSFPVLLGLSLSVFVNHPECTNLFECSGWSLLINDDDLDSLRREGAERPLLGPRAATDKTVANAGGDPPDTGTG